MIRRLLAVVFTTLTAVTIASAASPKASAPAAAAAQPGRPTAVVDVTAVTGGRVTGPVTSWQTKNGPYNVEHLAGRSPMGDLLVFYWSPQHDWRLVNVSQKTGRKIAGTVTSWQTTSGPYNVEHLAGVSPTGDLLVFWWSPLRDWQAVNVSQKTGRKVAGPVTSWQARRGSDNAELLAGPSPNGELLVFTWTRNDDWRAVSLGQQIVGPPTSWKSPGWPMDGEHLAGRSPAGDLLVFDFDALRGWRTANVSQVTGRKIAGAVSNWTTGSGSSRVEHLAGRSSGGDLFVFWRSSGNDWKSVNVTQITGEKVSGTPTPYFLRDGEETVEVLGVRSAAGGLLLHWWKPSRDWQALNVSELTNRTVAADPVGWLTPNGVEHLAAAGSDEHLRVFWGFSRERYLTDALGRPFESLKRTRRVRSKVLTILWDPHKPDIPQPSKSQMQSTLYGATNSVRDYYLENSNGLFTIENAGMLGWYDSKYPPSSYWPGNGKAGRDSGAEAIRKAAQEFDFKAYDTNRDGRLDRRELAILFILPGKGDGGGLNRTVGEDYTTRNTASGITVDGVEITQIAEVSIGAPPGPGIIAHELGHLLLDLGDMYVDKFSTPSAPGPYSLMDQDGRAPHIDPFGKLKLGWLRPKIIFRGGRYSLADVESRYRVWILMDPQRGPNEYFIVENRWRGSSYDRVLPDQGLAVWHILADRSLYETALPPQGVSASDWAKLGSGAWARKAIRLVRPRPVYSDGMSLWDASVGFDLLSSAPPSRSSLRWGDGSPSGFALRAISAEGSTMQATIDVAGQAARRAGARG